MLSWGPRASQEPNLYDNKINVHTPGLVNLCISLWIFNLVSTSLLCSPTCQIENWPVMKRRLMPDLDSSLVKKALNITVRGQRFVVIVVYIYMASFLYVFGMDWIFFQPLMNAIKPMENNNHGYKWWLYIWPQSLWGCFVMQESLPGGADIECPYQTPLEASRGVKGWWRMMNP